MGDCGGPHRFPSYVGDMRKGRSITPAIALCGGESNTNPYNVDVNVSRAAAKANLPAGAGGNTVPSSTAVVKGARRGIDFSSGSFSFNY